MTFLPAKPNHGIKFQRIDMEGQPIVNADVDNVVDLSRGTTIEESGARINTVEHTLAALVGLEIDNVLIQLDGPEPPIMDGSSIQFVKILKEAETQKFLFGNDKNSWKVTFDWLIKNESNYIKILERNYERNGSGKISDEESESIAEHFFGENG